MIQGKPLPSIIKMSVTLPGFFSGLLFSFFRTYSLAHVLQITYFDLNHKDQRQLLSKTCWTSFKEKLFPWAVLLTTVDPPFSGQLLSSIQVFYFIFVYFVTTAFALGL